MAKVPYLPIGSVVLLKNTMKRVMIYGRIVRSNDEEEVYDYVGCPYPEGAMSNHDMLLFNHEQIQMVYFIGFQDLEEIAMRQVLAQKRDEEEKAAGQETGTEQNVEIKRDVETAQAIQDERGES